jgi:ABC-2 type transport system permease protein
MNAVVDTTTHPPSARGAGIPAMRRFGWLVRRELWEHKGGFFWAPLVAGAVSLLLTLLGAATGQFFISRHGASEVRVNGSKVPLGQVDWQHFFEQASPEDLRQFHDAMNAVTWMSSLWPVTVFGFVVFFYFLGSLYDERKDRSVLFWKSLPVSDRDTVLSKLVTGLVVGPVIAALLSIATMLGFGLITTVFLAINGANPFAVYWSQLDPLFLAGNSLLWIPIYALWALPTAGWLMLCSAWARSKPFLWATAVPVVAGLLVSWFEIMDIFNERAVWFWENIVARVLLSAWPGSHFMGYLGSGRLRHLEDSPEMLFGLDGLLAGGHLLARPSLWIGVAAGALMVYGAIRLRRWRDEG